MELVPEWQGYDEAIRKFEASLEESDHYEEFIGQEPQEDKTEL